MRPSIALLGLAACAHTPDTTVDSLPAVSEDVDLMEQARRVDEQVQADLARLDALDLFDVGELVGGDASEAFHCYGPCEDAEATVRDYTERAARLHELVNVAEQAAGDTDTEACPMYAVDEHLQVLRDLDVVEIGLFRPEEAQTSPNCYNLPCPEDQAAADTETCARAARIERIIQEL